jgi:Uma2 family endonuclease
MALASEKVMTAPLRLLAGLRRAGMSIADIARVYDLSREVIRGVVDLPFEPLCVEDMELLRDDDHRYELWDGELWRMSPTKKRHGRGTTRIARQLILHLELRPTGSLYLGEVGFRVGPRQRLVCPDAAYVSHERDAPVGDDEFFPYAPDIAVEVLSPDNTWPKVRRKARAYLASGALLVWAIDPRRRTVTVYRPGAEPQLLRGDDVLSGEEVLPGFAVRVADLF